MCMSDSGNYSEYKNAGCTALVICGLFSLIFTGGSHLLFGRKKKFGLPWVSVGLISSPFYFEKNKQFWMGIVRDVISFPCLAAHY